MPLTLVLTPHASLAVPQDSRPLWRRLHAIAEATRPQVQTLWQMSVLDFRRRLHVRRTRQAHQQGLLALETLWRETWAKTVAQPVRQFLPLLVETMLTAAAQVTMPTLVEEDGDVAYVIGLPEDRQEATMYTGTQEHLIWRTTLLALRQAAQYARMQQWSDTHTALWLQTVAGLTPSQVHTLERAQAQREADGQTQAQTFSQLQQSATQGLMRRVQAMAETQSYASMNMGSQAAVSQAVRRGLVVLGLRRRYWIVTPDEKLCQRCRSMAEANAAGVGLFEPFHSLEGDLMSPPLHASCRCVLEVR